MVQSKLRYYCSSTESDDPPPTNETGAESMGDVNAGVENASSRDVNTGEGKTTESTVVEEPEGENSDDEEEEEVERSEEEEEGKSGEEEAQMAKDKVVEPTGDGEEEDETDSDDDSPLALLPNEMYIRPEFYNRTMKIGTSCFIAKAVKNLEKVLDKDEIKWFHDHPQFRHFFHMPRESNHMTMGFYMLLLRTAKIVKNKELWFLVNGVPIRYSMSEHALISGLDCSPFPKKYDEKGDMSFVNKHFKKVKCTSKEVEKKFLSMKKNDTDDRLKMGILYFLSSVMKGSGKRGESAPLVDKFFRMVVTDLDYCITFPWGRYTFLDNLVQIKSLLRRMNGAVVQEHVNFPSFIVSLELLAFEAIPVLMTKFREIEEDERLGCPRMCKSKFQPCPLKGWPIDDLYRELGETKVIHSILKPAEDEKELVYELFDAETEGDSFDGVVESWTNRLNEGREVWFKDLFREDIDCRSKVAKKPRKTPKVTATRTENASLIAEVQELRETVLELDGRLKQAEEMIVLLSQSLDRQPLYGVPPVETETEKKSSKKRKRSSKKRKRSSKERKESGKKKKTKDVSPEEVTEEDEAEDVIEDLTPKEVTEDVAAEDVLEDLPPEDVPENVAAQDVGEPEKKRKRRGRKTHSSVRKPPFEKRVTRGMKSREGEEGNVGAGDA